jgi:hypothetical protein
MQRRRLKYLLALSCGLLAVTAHAATADKEAARGPWADADHVIYTPARGHEFESPLDKACGTNHGGPVMTNPARLVYLFWGPSFCAGGTDRAYATTLQAYRNQLGRTPEWAVLRQYGVPLTDLGLGTPDWFDCSTPPTNVTDAIVQSKVNAYLATHVFNPNAIYEVVIPRTSYSSSGSSTSCGGPSLAYCAYHSWIGSGVNAKKYTIQPYPSCSGCQVTGWSDVQNQEHFVLHETRETVTDPTGLGWFDSMGYELDDKCAWSPPPFIGTNGYAYQYEWSVATCSCVKF